MKEWFVIKDLSQFIDTTRSLVFNSFGDKKNKNWDELKLDVLDTEKEELDTILSHEECLTIANDILRKQTNKKTLKQRYLVSDQSYYKFVDALNQRMIGNLLQGLVSKGLVETAFDSETNDFIFWVKDDKTQEDPKAD